MKTKIGIAGASGRIGQRLINLINAQSSLRVSSALVSENSKSLHQKQAGVLLESEFGHADVWIDFSTPEAFEKTLKHCLATQTPLVSGTTGLTQNHFEALIKAGTHIPVLWASNFSLSINLLQQFLQKYTQLTSGLDIQIEETHHIHKVDAPSGTALSLAKSCNRSGELKDLGDMNFQFDDIVLKSFREGEVPGTHKIQLHHESEALNIVHAAKTPEIFAQGALNVALWLLRQSKGCYQMSDYLESLS